MKPLNEYKNWEITGSDKLWYVPLYDATFGGKDVKDRLIALGFEITDTKGMCYVVRAPVGWVLARYDEFWSYVFDASATKQFGVFRKLDRYDTRQFTQIEGMVVVDPLTIKASEFVKHFPYGREDAEFYLASGAQVVSAYAATHTDAPYCFRLTGVDNLERYYLRASTQFIVKPLTEAARVEFSLTPAQRDWLRILKRGSTWIEDGRAKKQSITVRRYTTQKGEQQLGKISAKTLKALLPFFKQRYYPGTEREILVYSDEGLIDWVACTAYDQPLFPGANDKMLWQYYWELEEHINDQESHHIPCDLAKREARVLWRYLSSE